MSIELYPVVHINEHRQALGQVALALEKGADGVFLIDHHSTDERRLLEVYDEADDKFPNSFIGINALALAESYPNNPSPVQVFQALIRAKNRGEIGRYPKGLWVDDAVSRSREVHSYRHSTLELPAIRYLGGVAFKGSPDYTDEPHIAAAEASRMERYVDVVVTSGQGTGFPPSPEKIEFMKEALRSRPLAVASGIDTNNLPDYAGSIDQLLVASSIETEKYSGIFDESRLVDLIEAAHELESAETRS